MQSRWAMGWNIKCFAPKFGMGGERKRKEKICNLLLWIQKVIAVVVVVVVIINRNGGRAVVFSVFVFFSHFLFCVVDGNKCVCVGERELKWQSQRRGGGREKKKKSNCCYGNHDLQNEGACFQPPLWPSKIFFSWEKKKKNSYFCVISLEGGKVS